MKAVKEKINHTEDSCFHCEKVCLPYFVSPWHFHDEYEINLVTAGSGNAIIGDRVMKFTPGSLFLIGCGLPHVLINHPDHYATDSKLDAASVVIRFYDDFLGDSFFDQPEMILLVRMLQRSQRGLLFHASAGDLLWHLLTGLPNMQQFDRVLALLQILNTVSLIPESLVLASKGYSGEYSIEDCQRMDKVFKYITSRFNQRIRLEAVAEVANLSPPSFCRYFKSRTNKTFSDFLNEIRIGHACKLLIESDMNSCEIAYLSGFNSLSHFHKQFQKLKLCTPLEYKHRYWGHIQANSDKAKAVDLLK